MKIQKYNHLKSGQVNVSSIVGGGGSGSSTTIQGNSFELDRTIWGKQDTGEDIDGSMIVNGDINIKVIEPLPLENDEDDDGSGEYEEYEEGGGNLNVELKTTTKDLEVSNDAYIQKHLYINHSHSDHADKKVCLIDEVEKNTNRIGSLETSVDSLDTNLQMAETSIKNNADEIAKLKQRTTANETAIQNFLPIGSIIMFSGTMGEIPDGWAICNGENGTPNLIGKFIKAWTSAGETGGKATNNFDVGVAEHSHTYSISPSSPGKGFVISKGDSLKTGVIDWGGDKNFCLLNGYETNNEYYTQQNTLSGSTANFASGTTSFSLDNEPPYYSLIYIMKIA